MQISYVGYTLFETEKRLYPHSSGSAALSQDPWPPGNGKDVCLRRGLISIGQRLMSALAPYCPHLRELTPMANDGSSPWGWVSHYVITLLQVPARTSLARRNTITKAPQDHSTPALFHYSAPGQRKEIKFYHKGRPYYEFTNFAPYDVIHKGKRYPTSEHLFQAFKVRSVGLTMGVCSL